MIYCCVMDAGFAHQTPSHDHDEPNSDHDSSLYMGRCSGRLHSVALLDNNNALDYTVIMGKQFLPCLVTSVRILDDKAHFLKRSDIPLKILK